MQLIGASHTQIMSLKQFSVSFGHPQSHQTDLRSGTLPSYPIPPNRRREGDGRSQWVRPSTGNLRELWRPGLRKPEVSQSLVWQTFCSAKNIIPRFKFPLLNPEVQCRNGPSAHKKQREIWCYKKRGSTCLGAKQVVKTEETLSAVFYFLITEILHH